MTPDSRGKKLLADFGLLYAATVWGATFFVVKDSLKSIDPVVLVGYRFLLAALILAVGLLVARKSLVKHWKSSLVLGLMLWTLYITQTVGLKYTTAANSGFITGLFVAFVPPFSYFLYRKVPTSVQLVAVLISLAGLWLLTGGLKEINKGDMITLVSAMAYAGHLLYVDLFMKRGFDPYIMSFQQFLLVGVLSIMTAGVLRLPFAITSTTGVAQLLFLTVFPTLSAFVIQLIAQKITPPIRVALVLALEPVFAALFAWTLGGEVFESHRAVGGALIFVAMIMSGLPPKRLRLRRSA